MGGLYSYNRIKGSKKKAEGEVAAEQGTEREKQKERRKREGEKRKSLQKNFRKKELIFSHILTQISPPF